MSVLRLEHIDAGYGRRTVLQDLSLEVNAGEIVALIGPNGAGKSTVLRVAAGFLEQQQGRVWFKEEDITGRAPYERIDQGLAFCIQGGRVFPSLTVMENLEMGAVELSAEEKGRGSEAVLDLFPNLQPLLDRRAGVLSGGERQALALGMVLVRQPEMLLLDEPSAGLSPRLVQDLLERVRTLNEDWNLSILIVEQNLRAALRIAHRAVALEDGAIAGVAEEPQAWLDGEEMKRLFLGYGVAENRE